MFQRTSRRVAILAAGVLALSIAACGDGEEKDSGKENLSSNRAAAMAKYGVGDQFKATEPVTFSVLYNNHSFYQLKEDWLFWSELEKRTNVKLDKVVVPLSDYEQKRNLLIASGEAPMIIPKTYPGQETSFVSSGAVLPVSEYIDLMPNLKDKISKWNLKADVDTLRQMDGKYYLLPGMHEKLWLDYSFVVRADIMEQLNLKTPETLDDFYKMLKAMKAAHPDLYPLSDRWSKPTPGGSLFNVIGTAFGAPGGWGYQHVTWNPKAKKFELTGAMNQYKDMVTYLNKLVKEGLLDPESFTQTDDQARQKLANGKSFVIGGNAQVLVNEYRKDMTVPNAKLVKIPIPKGPMGNKVLSTRLENGVMVSKKARDSKNFVAMMQFIDWLWYSDAGQEFAKWGVEGTTYTKEGDKRKLAKDVDYVGLNPGAPKHLQKDFGFGNGVFAYGGKTDLLQSTFSEEELAFQKAISDRELIVRPPAPLSDEQREQATLWETPLKDYVTQMTLKFVLGQRDLGEWDAYLAELKGKNMTQYVDMINKASEQYQKEHG